MGIVGPAIFLALCFLAPISCEDVVQRDAKFSIFQIIKFQNGPCGGTTGARNGTCFTKAECENQGGTEGGECADGFGVCCITMLAQGQTTSLNQSYIVHTATTTPALTSGKYTICPCSEDVCRIRFDFTDFQLQPPFTSPPVAAPNANQLGNALGDCLVDTFSITGVNGGSTPVICGVNTNQHVYVDSNGKDCHTVNLGIGGGGAANTRSLDIMVTQYRCGEEMGGPPGCLQWHDTPTGKIRSFNFPDQQPGTFVPDTATHLSNQQYDICIRQPAGTTFICYTPCTVQNNVAPNVNGGMTNMQSSFGVSVGQAAMTSETKASSCTSDYITIVGGDTKANAAMAVAVTSFQTRFCARALDVTLAGATEQAQASVCTTTLPFKVGVNFDDHEETTGNAKDTNELSTFPGGIVGFALCYTTT